MGTASSALPPNSTRNRFISTKEPPPIRSFEVSPPAAGTAAITMRLLVDSDIKPAGGIVGAGFDEFRWPRPVRPGDELRVESEVLEIRASKSRPDQGVIKVRTTTLNQNNEPVQVSLGNLIVRCRPTFSGGRHG